MRLRTVLALVLSMFLIVFVVLACVAVHLVRSYERTEHRQQAGLTDKNKRSQRKSRAKSNQRSDANVGTQQSSPESQSAAPAVSDSGGTIDSSGYTVTLTLPSGETTTVHRVGPPAMYPRPDLTPGVFAANVGKEQVCTDGYTDTVRHKFNLAERRFYFNRYGIPYDKRKHQIDHFLSLELGGDPMDPRNIWPEAFSPLPGARQKDVVETWLHHQVCRHGMPLEQAQRLLLTDWLAVYLQIKSSNDSAEAEKEAQQSKRDDDDN